MTEDTKKPGGFMIYAEDWISFAEDFSDTEIGEVLKALILYFVTGEVKEFTDRAIRQFYKQGIRWINADTEKYRDRCLKNAYARYRGVCKENGIDPQPFEDWAINRGEAPTFVFSSCHFLPYCHQINEHA